MCGVERTSRNRIFDELRWLIETDTARINVADPTFNSTSTHSVMVLDALTAFCTTTNKSPVVTLQTRPEKINKTFLDAIERCPAKFVLECGVQTAALEELELIGRVKGRVDAHAIVKKVDDKLALVRERGVAFEISLIYGLPRQTLDSFRVSLDWARETGATRVAAHPLMLLRGTEMQRQSHVLGLSESLMPRPVGGGDRLQEFIPHVVSTPTMTTADWLRAGALANVAARGGADMAHRVRERA